MSDMLFAMLLAILSVTDTPVSRIPEFRHTDMCVELVERAYEGLSVLDGEDIPDDVANDVYQLQSDCFADN